MVQNSFNKKKHMRRIIVLFKNPHDSCQFLHLAKQLYPHNARFAYEAYVKATRTAYGYRSLDLKSEHDDDLRLRTNIIRIFVYIPK